MQALEWQAKAKTDDLLALNLTISLVCQVSLTHRLRIKRHCFRAEKIVRTFASASGRPAFPSLVYRVEDRPSGDLNARLLSSTRDPVRLFEKRAFEMIPMGRLTARRKSRPEAPAPPKLPDLYRRFFEDAPVGFAVCLMNGDFIKVNQAFADLMGRQIKDLIGVSYRSFTPKKLEREDKEQIDEFQRTGQIGRFEKEYIHINEHVVPIRMIVKKIRIGQRDYMWVIGENYSTETYRVLFQKTTIGLALCEWDGTFVSVNEEYGNITGWTVDELLGRTRGGQRMTYWQITPRELHDQQEQEQLRNLEATGRYGPYKKSYLRKDGTHVPVTLTGLRLTIDKKDYIWSVVDRGLADLPSIPSSAAELQPILPLPKPLSCFISYSSQDEQFASLLYQKLRDRNLQVWFAPAKLRPGDKLNEAIAQGIDASDRLLLVLSKESMKSVWVKEELRKAREIEEEQGVRKLIPIRLVEYQEIELWHSHEWKVFWFGFGRDHAEDVKSYFIPDFSQWQDPEQFQKGLDSLLDVLLQRG